MLGSPVCVAEVETIRRREVARHGYPVVRDQEISCFGVVTLASAEIQAERAAHRLFVSIDADSRVAPGYRDLPLGRIYAVDNEALGTTPIGAGPGALALTCSARLRGNRRRRGPSSVGPLTVNTGINEREGGISFILQRDTSRSEWHGNPRSRYAVPARVLVFV